ncbi:titin homolog isoform X6 [Amphibalanus amphitrite]|uniref:titin homolog isoform X6 n=1 Tax=Amphibalanus amphitrite TaxID=1232801 RepID=UPI001C90D932|nr:titin homolog isoform X6 [Amphibalanus amphitrite]
MDPAGSWRGAGGPGGGGAGGGGGDHSASEMSRSGRRRFSRDWVRRNRHDSAEETSIDYSLTEDDNSVRVLLKCMGFHVDEELTEEERKERREQHLPHFVIRLKDTEILERASVVFMVKAEGQPEPTIEFFKDDVPLAQDDRVSLTRETSGAYELQIHHVRKQDAGVYKCVATNKKGQEECHGNITVTDDDTAVFSLLDKQKEIQDAENTNFTWFKDGEEFDPAERFKVLFKDEEDTLALVFQHVSPDDAGMYTCVAATESGRISCSAELTVQDVIYAPEVEGGVKQLPMEPEAPSVVEGLQKTEVSAGGSAMLECKLRGYPAVNVTWTLNGEEIKPGGRFRMLFEDSETVALIIKNVTEADAGKIQVTARNELGACTSEADLVIKGPPKFRKKIQDMAIMIDETVRIEVDIDGTPKPEVKWYKDGQKLTETDRLRLVEESDTKYVLLIDRMELTDAGSYSIVASNTMGQMSDFWKVTAQAPPKFTKQLLREVVKGEQESATLEVKIQGSPVPKVKWYKDGEEITVDGRHYSVENDGHIYTLTINGLTRTDSAKYTCKISNEFGQDETTCQLHVKCAPEIDSGLGDMDVHEGEPFTLEIEATGYPVPVVKWYIDDVEITEKQNLYKKEHDGKFFRLNVSTANSSIIGTYRCTMKNELGSCETSGFINVLKSPEFEEPLCDTGADENKPLTLKVKILAVPEPEVTWYRDGEPITAKSSEIQISRDGEYYSMTFSNVKEAHQGNYSVMAKNSQGENSSSMHLTVYTPGTRPSVSQPEGDERGAETGVGDGDDAAGMRRVVLQETLVSVTTDGDDATVISQTVTQRTDDGDSETRVERRGEARRASSAEETGAGEEKPAKRRKSSSEKGDGKKKKEKSGKRKEDEADHEGKSKKKKKKDGDIMDTAAKTVRFMEEEQRKESDDFWGDQTMGEAEDDTHSESQNRRDSRDRSGRNAEDDLIESAERAVRLMEEEQRKESDDFWGEKTADDHHESHEKTRRDSDTTDKTRKKSKDQDIGGGTKKTKTVHEEYTVEMESEYSDGQGDSQRKGDSTDKRKVSKKMTMTVTEEHSSQAGSEGDGGAADSKALKKSRQIGAKDEQTQAWDEQGKRNDDDGFMDNFSKTVKSLHDEQQKESEVFWSDDKEDKGPTANKPTSKREDETAIAKRKGVSDEDFIESVSKTVRSMVDEQDEESRAFWGDDSNKKDTEGGKERKQRDAQTQDEDYEDDDKRSRKHRSEVKTSRKDSVSTKSEIDEQIIDSDEVRQKGIDEDSRVTKKRKKSLQKDSEEETEERRREDGDSHPGKDGKKVIKKTVKTTYEEEISEVEDLVGVKPKPRGEGKDKSKRDRKQDIKIIHEAKSDNHQDLLTKFEGDDGDAFMDKASKTVMFMRDEQQKESDDFWGDMKDEAIQSDVIKKITKQTAGADEDEESCHGVKHKRQDQSPTDSDDGTDRIAKTVKSMKTEETITTKDAMEADDYIPEGLTPEEVAAGPREPSMPDQPQQKKPSKHYDQDKPRTDAPVDGGPGPPETQPESTIPPTDWSGDSLFSDQAAQLDAMRRQMQADSDAFWGRDSDQCRVQEISSEPWEGGRPERSARRPASQQSGIVQEFESDDGASETATAAGDSLHRQTHYQQVITTVIKDDGERVTTRSQVLETSGGEYGEATTVHVSEETDRRLGGGRAHDGMHSGDEVHASRARSLRDAGTETVVQEGKAVPKDKSAESRGTEMDHDAEGDIENVQQKKPKRLERDVPIHQDVSSETGKDVPIVQDDFEEEQSKDRDVLIDQREAAVGKAKEIPIHQDDKIASERDVPIFQDKPEEETSEREIPIQRLDEAEDRKDERDIPIQQDDEKPVKDVPIILDDSKDAEDTGKEVYIQQDIDRREDDNIEVAHKDAEHRTSDTKVPVEDRTDEIHEPDGKTSMQHESVAASDEETLTQQQSQEVQTEQDAPDIKADVGARDAVDDGTGTAHLGGGTDKHVVKKRSKTVVTESSDEEGSGRGSPKRKSKHQADKVSGKEDQEPSDAPDEHDAETSRKTEDDRIDKVAEKDVLVVQEKLDKDSAEDTEKQSTEADAPVPEDDDENVQMSLDSKTVTLGGEVKVETAMGEEKQITMDSDGGFNETDKKLTEAPQKLRPDEEGEKQAPVSSDADTEAKKDSEEPAFGLTTTEAPEATDVSTFTDNENKRHDEISEQKEKDTAATISEQPSDRKPLSRRLSEESVGKDITAQDDKIFASKPEKKSTPIIEEQPQENVAPQKTPLDEGEAKISEAEEDLHLGGGTDKEYKEEAPLKEPPEEDFLDYRTTESENADKELSSLNETEDNEGQETQTVPADLEFNAESEKYTRSQSDERDAKTQTADDVQKIQEETSVPADADIVSHPKDDEKDVAIEETVPAKLGGEVQLKEWGKAKEGDVMEGNRTISDDEQETSTSGVAVTQKENRASLEDEDLSRHAKDVCEENVAEVADTFDSSGEQVELKATTETGPSKAQDTMQDTKGKPDSTDAKLEEEPIVTGDEPCEVSDTKEDDVEDANASPKSTSDETITEEDVTSVTIARKASGPEKVSVDEDDFWAQLASKDDEATEQAEGSKDLHTSAKGSESVEEQTSDEVETLAKHDETKTISKDEPDTGDVQSGERQPEEDVRLGGGRTKTDTDKGDTETPLVVREEVPTPDAAADETVHANDGETVEKAEVLSEVNVMPIRDEDNEVVSPSSQDGADGDGQFVKTTDEEIQDENDGQRKGPEATADGAKVPSEPKVTADVDAEAGEHESAAEGETFTKPSIASKEEKADKVQETELDQLKQTGESIIADHEEMSNDKSLQMSSGDELQQHEKENVETAIAGPDASADIDLRTSDSELDQNEAAAKVKIKAPKDAKDTGDMSAEMTLEESQSAEESAEYNVKGDAIEMQQDDGEATATVAVKPDSDAAGPDVGVTDVESQTREDSDGRKKSDKITRDDESQVDFWAQLDQKTDDDQESEEPARIDIVMPDSKDQNEAAAKIKIKSPTDAKDKGDMSAEMTLEESQKAQQPAEYNVQGDAIEIQDDEEATATVAVKLDSDAAEPDVAVTDVEFQTKEDSDGRKKSDQATQDDESQVDFWAQLDRKTDDDQGSEEPARIDVTLPDSETDENEAAAKIKIKSPKETKEKGDMSAEMTLEESQSAQESAEYNVQGDSIEMQRQDDEEATATVDGKPESTVAKTEEALTDVESQTREDSDGRKKSDKVTQGDESQIDFLAQLDQKSDDGQGIEGPDRVDITLPDSETDENEVAAKIKIKSPKDTKEKGDMSAEMTLEESQSAQESAEYNVQGDAIEMQCQDDEEAVATVAVKPDSDAAEPDAGITDVESQTREASDALKDQVTQDDESQVDFWAQLDTKNDERDIDRLVDEKDAAETEAAVIVETTEKQTVPSDVSSPHEKLSSDKDQEEEKADRIGGGVAQEASAGHQDTPEQLDTQTDKPSKPSSKKSKKQKKALSTDEENVAQEKDGVKTELANVPESGEKQKPHEAALMEPQEKEDDAASFNSVKLGDEARLQKEKEDELHGEGDASKEAAHPADEDNAVDFWSQLAQEKDSLASALKPDEKAGMEESSKAQTLPAQKDQESDEVVPSKGDNSSPVDIKDIENNQATTDTKEEAPDEKPERKAEVKKPKRKKSKQKIIESEAEKPTVAEEQKESPLIADSQTKDGTGEDFWAQLAPETEDTLEKPQNIESDDSKDKAKTPSSDDTKPEHLDDSQLPLPDKEHDAATTQATESDDAQSKLLEDASVGDSKSDKLKKEDIPSIDEVKEESVPEKPDALIEGTSDIKNQINEVENDAVTAVKMSGDQKEDEGFGSKIKDESEETPEVNNKEERKIDKPIERALVEDQRHQAETDDGDRKEKDTKDKKKKARKGSIKDKVAEGQKQEVEKGDVLQKGEQTQAKEDEGTDFWAQLADDKDTTEPQAEERLQASEKDVQATEDQLQKDDQTKGPEVLEDIQGAKTQTNDGIPDVGKSAEQAEGGDTPKDSVADSSKPKADADDKVKPKEKKKRKKKETKADLEKKPDTDKKTKETDQDVSPVSEALNADGTKNTDLIKRSVEETLDASQDIKANEADVSNGESKKLHQAEESNIQDAAQETEAKLELDELNKVSEATKTPGKDSTASQSKKVDESDATTEQKEEGDAKPDTDVKDVKSTDDTEGKPDSSTTKDKKNPKATDKKKPKTTGKKKAEDNESKERLKDEPPKDDSMKKVTQETSESKAADKNAECEKVDFWSQLNQNAEEKPNVSGDTKTNENEPGELKEDKLVVQAKDGELQHSKSETSDGDETETTAPAKTKKVEFSGGKDHEQVEEKLEDQADRPALQKKVSFNLDDSNADESDVVQDKGHEQSDLTEDTAEHKLKSPPPSPVPGLLEPQETLALIADLGEMKAGTALLKLGDEEEQHLSVSSIDEGQHAEKGDADIASDSAEEVEWDDDATLASNKKARTKEMQITDDDLTAKKNESMPEDRATTDDVQPEKSKAADGDADKVKGKREHPPENKPEVSAPNVEHEGVEEEKGIETKTEEEKDVSKLSRKSEASKDDFEPIAKDVKDKVLEKGVLDTEPEGPLQKQQPKEQGEDAREDQPKEIDKLDAKQRKTEELQEKHAPQKNIEDSPRPKEESDKEDKTKPEKRVRKRSSLKPDEASNEQKELPENSEMKPEKRLRRRRSQKADEDVTDSQTKTEHADKRAKADESVRSFEKSSEDIAKEKEEGDRHPSDVSDEKTSPQSTSKGRDKDAVEKPDIPEEAERKEVPESKELSISKVPEDSKVESPAESDKLDESKPEKRVRKRPSLKSDEAVTEEPGETSTKPDEHKPEKRLRRRRSQKSDGVAKDQKEITGEAEKSPKADEELKTQRPAENAAGKQDSPSRLDGDADVTDSSKRRPSKGEGKDVPEKQPESLDKSDQKEHAKTKTKPDESALEEGADTPDDSKPEKPVRKRPSLKSDGAIADEQKAIPDEKKPEKRLRRRRSQKYVEDATNDKRETTEKTENVPQLDGERQSQKVDEIAEEEKEAADSPDKRVRKRASKSPDDVAQEEKPGGDEKESEDLKPDIQQQPAEKADESITEKDQHTVHDEDLTPKAFEQEQEKKSRRPDQETKQEKQARRSKPESKEEPSVNDDEKPGEDKERREKPRRRLSKQRSKDKEVIQSKPDKEKDVDISTQEKEHIGREEPLPEKDGRRRSTGEKRVKPKKDLEMKTQKTADDVSQKPSTKSSENEMADKAQDVDTPNKDKEEPRDAKPYRPSARKDKAPENDQQPHPTSSHKKAGDEFKTGDKKASPTKLDDGKLERKILDYDRPRDHKFDRPGDHDVNGRPSTDDRRGPRPTGGLGDRRPLEDRNRLSRDYDTRPRNIRHDGKDRSPSDYDHGRPRDYKENRRGVHDAHRYKTPDYDKPHQRDTQGHRIPRHDRSPRSGDHHIPGVRTPGSRSRYPLDYDVEGRSRPRDVNDRQRYDYNISSVGARHEGMDYRPQYYDIQGRRPGPPGEFDIHDYTLRQDFEGRRPTNYDSHVLPRVPPHDALPRYGGYQIQDLMIPRGDDYRSPERRDIYGYRMPRGDGILHIDDYRSPERRDIYGYRIPYGDKIFHIDGYRDGNVPRDHDHNRDRSSLDLDALDVSRRPQGLLETTLRHSDIPPRKRMVGDLPEDYDVYGYVILDYLSGDKEPEYHRMGFDIYGRKPSPDSKEGLPADYDISDWSPRHDASAPSHRRTDEDVSIRAPSHDGSRGPDAASYDSPGHRIPHDSKDQKPHRKHVDFDSHVDISRDSRTSRPRRKSHDARLYQTDEGTREHKHLPKDRDKRRHSIPLDSRMYQHPSGDVDARGRRVPHYDKRWVLRPGDYYDIHGHMIPRDGKGFDYYEGIYDAYGRRIPNEELFYIPGGYDIHDRTRLSGSKAPGSLTKGYDIYGRRTPHDKAHFLPSEYDIYGRRILGPGVYAPLGGIGSFRAPSDALVEASLPSEYSILGYVIVPDVSRREGPEPTLVRYDLFGYRLPEIGRRPDLSPEDFDICGHALLHERSEADSGEYRPVDYAVFGRRALPGWQPPPVDSSLLGHITLRDWDSEGGGHTPFTLYGQRTLQDVLIDRGPRAGVHSPWGRRSSPPPGLRRLRLADLDTERGFGGPGRRVLTTRSRPRTRREIVAQLSVPPWTTIWPGRPLPEVRSEGDLALPQILTKFTDLICYINENKILVIEGYGNPIPDPHWFMDGNEIHSSENYVIQQDKHKYRLIIPRVKYEDAGSYKLTLKNRMGEVTEQCKLIVKPLSDLKEPHFFTHLVDNVKMKGEETVMSVEIRGIPQPDVKWYKDGVELAPDVNIMMTRDVDTCVYTLKIRNTGDEDMGDYACVATNEHGEMREECRLEVLFKPEIAGLREVAVIPGESARFHATVKANPKCRLKWQHDGMDLRSTENLIIETNAENTETSLRIQTVGMRDGGVYSVVAENAHGETTSNGVLLLRTAIPAFKKRLLNTGARLGQKLLLEAVVAGLPVPDVQWFKDGKPLEVERVDEQTFRHQVEATTSPDYGEYRVVAMNCVGTTESSCTVTEEVLPPVIDARLPTFSKKEEGDTLVLEAKVDGSPPPEITWMKDGEPLELSDRVKIEQLDDGTVRLTVTDLRPEDAGRYRMKASNGNGDACTESAVTVDRVPRKPSFDQTLGDVTVTEGKPLKLEARVLGYPRPVLKWLKNGRPLHGTEHISITTTPQGTTLVEIEGATPEDAGTYSVMAVNDLGDATVEADVTVEPPHRKPLMQDAFRPVRAVEGCPARIEGRVSGHPPPTVTWYKDGKPLDANDRGKPYLLPDGTFGLAFDRCLPEDSGAYTAKISNSEGDAEAAAKMEVIGKQRPGEHCAPAFTSPLRDTEVAEGSTLVLTADVTGNPLPDVSWTRDGAPLPSDERVFTGFDGDKLTLTIRPARVKDVGRYQVSLSNALGQADSAADVKVKKTYQAPHFAQKIFDLQQMPKYDAKFMGRVIGIPRPEVQWFFNDTPIKPSSKYRIKRDADMFALYVIDCCPDDAGVYSCVATNADGTSKCSANLEVVDHIARRPKPEPPYFLKTIGDCEVYPGMQGKFTACVAGYPEPDFEWYRDDMRMFPSDRILMEADGSGLIRLILKNADEGDSGRYKLKIFNTHGEAACEAELSYDTFDGMSSTRNLKDQYGTLEQQLKSGIPMPLSERPIISRMTDRQLTLSWRPSPTAGQRIPVTYHVEMAEAPRGDWFTVRSGIRGCSVEIRNLEPHRDYKFRIKVENKLGVSEPSPHITTQRERLVPDPPESMHLRDGETFLPDMSSYFPRDFDMDKWTGGRAHAPTPVSVQYQTAVRRHYLAVEPGEERVPRSTRGGDQPDGAHRERPPRAEIGPRSHVVERMLVRKQIEEAGRQAERCAGLHGSMRPTRAARRLDALAAGRRRRRALAALEDSSEGEEEEEKMERMSERRERLSPRRDWQAEFEKQVHYRGRSALRGCSDIDAWESKFMERV